MSINEGIMPRDYPENGLLVQELPNGMVVSEEMGLSPSVDASQPEDVNSSESLGEQELRKILEALLFVSHEPITLEKLTTVIDGPQKLEVHNVLQLLQRDYAQEGKGLRIVEVAGGFMMVTCSDCAPWITRLQKAKSSSKLSKSALETLAIIAYRQPIVRADIEHIRGVETAGVLRTLLDLKLARIVGRKDVPGRPIMYGTSKIFLQRFGLRDLRDLPPLREFKDLGDIGVPDLFDSQNGGMENIENKEVEEAFEENGAPIIDHEAEVPENS